VGADRGVRRTGLEDRRRLIAHLEWVIHPGIAGWFADQIAEAIELAAGW